MAINNYAESWTDTYDKYKSIINFVAGDFDTLKDAIRRYIVLQNPENYNDWAESSEVGMFANGLAYLGESLHYRVDLNAHDIFPSTTERRQSLLNFAKMLSYSPKRNIGALGIAKLVSIQTTQSIRDTAGNLLQNTPIYWNDSSNKEWLEQFLTVMNSAFVSTNPFGKPLKKESVNGITTQTYQLNNTINARAVYSFTTSINGSTQQFEIVNPDIDIDTKTIYERSPAPEQAFHILYRNDGTGNGSKNTGFFVYWKQGGLQSEYYNFENKIENNFYEITTKNINQYDVWVQELDSETGLVKNNWTKIANDEYLVYNNTDINERNIFKVETRENDTVIIRFSDGKFGTIPVGIFRFWYRVSQGNMNLYIKPADIKNISISIPYKTNNTSDQNVYYLTLTFTVQDISHIRQSVPQESMEYIRVRSPQVYSTQNRMVTGQDYNYFPKSFGQQLKVVKAIERTYAGNSRYVKFNDPTGVYQDVNVLAEDGYIYKEDFLYENDYTNEANLNSETIIDRYILPLISSQNFDNFIYANMNTIQYTYNNKKMFWYENRSDGTNNSRGVLKYKQNDIMTDVPYSSVANQLHKGSFVKFVSVDSISNDAPIKNESWIKILDIIEQDEGDYEIIIDDVLNFDDAKFWRLEYGYNPVKKSLKTSEIYNSLKNKINDMQSFGLGYSTTSMDWVLLDGDQLSNDDSLPYDNTENFSGDNLTSWLLKAEFTSPNNWKFKIRWSEYIFGSENKVTFFFNEDEKLNNTTGFYTRDYIKVLKDVNDDIDIDYYWKPGETIKYTDGYTEPHRVKVYGYDSDKDSSIDNPIQFTEMMGNELKDLFFMKNDDELVYMNNVTTIPSFWTETNCYTTKNGIYYIDTPGTVYKAGTFLPRDVNLTRRVKLSNGSYRSEGTTFYKDYSYPFDVVDEGYKVTWLKDSNGKIIGEPIVESFEGPALISYTSLTGEIVEINDDEYVTKQGRNNLKFIWEHFASSNYVIDPCPTNIIDMYALTNTYYESVQNWLKIGKKGIFPKLPSAYEMKSMFSELNKYSMVSDSLVWHPIKYKVLFGNESDNEYRARFNVIKNEATLMSDNEIKQRVVEAIDEYFSYMEAGEKFFFTQLSTFIHERLGNNIGTIVIVPQYNNNKFGNLFEIACDENEILLSSASIDDITIISKITTNNIKIGE